MTRRRRGGLLEGGGRGGLNVPEVIGGERIGVPGGHGVLRRLRRGGFRRGLRLGRGLHGGLWSEAAGGRRDDGALGIGVVKEDVDVVPAFVVVVVFSPLSRDL